jgi:uncharacterized protein YbaP (TraB family)
MPAPTPDDIQAAQAGAQDRGLLWRITRGGHSSYLFGSLHVGTLAWAMPGPRLGRAIRETDTVALELDPSDPEVLRALTQGAPSAAAATAGLPEALARRLDQQRQAACLPEGAFGAMHPLMQAISLVVLQARHDGLEPGYGTEPVLAGAARTLNRPVVSLETVQGQLQALLPTQPAELHQALDELLAQLEQGRARPVLRRLAQAWANGNDKELDTYAQWCDCVKTDADRAFMRRLLDDRNPGLADGIDRLHRQGKKVLAAAGALHMLGPKGLPALLRAKGYQVQRVSAP